MLAKINRLPGYKIPLVLASRMTFHSPLFTLKVKPSSLKISQVGFIVSKKTAKKAVNRNRLKRLLREALKSNLKNLKPNHDLLFLAKPAIKNQSLSQITSQIIATLKQSNLLNEKTSS